MSDAVKSDFVEPPGQSPASATMGLVPGAPAQRPSAPTPVHDEAYWDAQRDKGILQGPTHQPVRSEGATPAAHGRNDVRDAAVKFWVGQGAPLHVAQGIADRINEESGYRPDAVGDGGTSGGQYQHHADRYERLKAFSARNGVNWTDPAAQNVMAAMEVKGLDPIAAKHWDEIKNAPTREAAKELWTRYFERPLQGWANSISPAMRESAQALTAEAERLSGQYHTDAAELMRLANAAPAGSKERDEAIAKLREREHDYALKYEAIASHPPAMKPVDALSNFGSAASIVGLLGGLFSRRHLTTALAASGAAMKAINENNHEEFQRQYKIWEQQSTTALNMVKLHNEEIRALIDDKKMAVDEKNSRLSTMFQALGMTRAADQMALGAHEKVFAEQANLERATMTAGANKLAFQQSVAAQLEAKYIGEGLAPEEARVRAAKEAGIIPGGQPTATKGREEALQKAIDADVVKFKSEHPGAKKVEVDAVAYQARLKHEQEIGQATHQARSAPAMAVQKYLQEHPDATSGDVTKFAADYARSVAVERAFGSGVEARKVTALNTVSDHALLLTEYATALRNGEIQRANQLLNALARETGKPEITNFQIARDFFADEVVSVLAQTGGGVTDRQEAKSRIGDVQSPEQLAGAIETAGRFITGRLHAIEQQYAQNDPTRRKHFETEMLTPGARQWFEKFEPTMPGAKPAAPKAGGEIIQNGWRYDATTHAPIGPAR